MGDKLKLAMKGTREQRAQLIRDSNKLVAAAVLSSPKLTEAEVEAFAKMANVSEDVLRIIGTNRSWVKNYGVIARPGAQSQDAAGDLDADAAAASTSKDVKMLAIDRNVPEALRLAARRLVGQVAPAVASPVRLLAALAETELLAHLGQALHVDGRPLTLVFALHRLEQVDGAIEVAQDGGRWS